MRNPSVIPFAAVRIECSHCGAEGRASCNCGVAYMPKKERAREAIKANPEKSDRAIAADLGLGNKTVSRARQELGVSHDTPERIGLDGKTYPARVEREEPDERHTVEHYRSALVIHAEQAADLANMFHASMKAQPSAITDEAISGASRAAEAWRLLAAQLRGERNGS